MMNKEKYDKIIEILGPERMEALMKFYEKHGNFYIYPGRLLKIMKNPKQTKYKLEDAIVFVKDKKKAARKKKKINQPRQAKFRAKAKAKGNIA